MTVRIAVVGHTNTGKTSLLRTLMRDTAFGEVSDRPAVTRRVEAVTLEVPDAEPIQLSDTPGLEDSPGLLEHLTASAGAAARNDPTGVIEAFLASDAAQRRFAQEAQAIGEIMRSSVALYVVDAREPVRGRHRDELTILGMCGRPIVPVLNFVAGTDARTDEWREHLRRIGMHAVATFDTVVYDEEGERRLYEKIATLRDEDRSALEALVAHRTAQRRTLERAACRLVAEMLVDVAALTLIIPLKDEAAARDGIAALKDAVRRREQACVDGLLDLFRFRRDDVEAAGLPIEDGAWGLDLFSAEALRQFGTRAGSAAAAGAAVGATIDVLLFAGLSLGTGALAGAAIGGAVGAVREHGRRVVERLRGRSELRVADGTLDLLAARQVALVRALLHRGHASLERLTLGTGGAGTGPVGTGPVVVGPAGAGAAPVRPGASRTVQLERVFERLPGSLGRARAHPAWSAVTVPGHPPVSQGLADSAARSDAVAVLAKDLHERTLLRQSRPAGTPSS